MCVSVYLGEEPPPLPILEFEVASTVPLNHLHGSQLGLPLTEHPARKQEKKGDFLCVRKINKKKKER